MTATKSGNGGLDEHICEQIAELDEAIVHIDEVFGNLNALDYHEVTKNMTSLDKAKYELTNMYAINSLFWMYLRSFGEDPKNTSIKEELDRIKKQMLRLSQIANKSKMPRIDKEAANRFVKHGLSKPGNKAMQVQQKSGGNSVPEAKDEENWDDDAMETDAIPGNVKTRKRKRECVEDIESESDSGDDDSS